MANHLKPAATFVGLWSYSLDQRQNTLETEKL